MSSGTKRRIAIRRSAPGSLGNLHIAGRIDGGRGVGPSNRWRSFAYTGYKASYGLVYVTAGSGRFRSDTHDVAVEAGSMITLFPGIEHWYGVTEVDRTWDEIFLIFSGPLFNLAVSRGLLNRNPPVRPLGPVSYWKHRFDEFRVRQPALSPSARDTEACDLLRMITEVHGVQTGSANRDAKQANNWFHRSTQLLEQAPDERLRLADIAQQVGMTYETWRRRFTERAGCPPGHYRILCRVHAAEELLSRTALPTREIADALGFSDVHHFIRQFRETIGVTPRQYRDFGGAPPAST